MEERMAVIAMMVVTNVMAVIVVLTQLSYGEGDGVGDGEGEDRDGCDDWWWL